MALIADRARLSVMGLAFRDTNASIACVSASIPVSAVSLYGYTNPGYVLLFLRILIRRVLSTPPFLALPSPVPLVGSPRKRRKNRTPKYPHVQLQRVSSRVFMRPGAFGGIG